MPKATESRSKFYAPAIKEMRLLFRMREMHRQEAEFPFRPHFVQSNIFRVARLLRSKRIPPEVRRHPLVADLVAYVRCFDDGDGSRAWKLEPLMTDPGLMVLQWIEEMQDALLGGFIDRFAQPLIDHLASLEDPMPHDTDGILSAESRGPTTIMTAAVPAEREAEFRAFVRGLHADRSPPVLDDIRLAADQNADAIRRMNVDRIWAYGSVAAGTAASASDIDLLYRTREGATDYDTWTELRRLFEGHTGRLVDLFPVINEEALSTKDAILVWTAEEPR
ncbi:hypothetical protein WV31_10615 [Magnetospirillum sp. ME-1]|uniref:nucleotidyltransferase family protein n=1 Tax=Magnetospirillum sp. ME-1 TaxID=1639348 RepID=UPI000A17AA97|nr:nucleotidyltransferase domain-containing protein [Magnetospirillum sp. ME-1]ARJ66080.1 hypothetical protein WV31_10615 [Magnetospirillum sp. ME-1]